MLRFGLFGHPVGHSLSPAMHSASFRSLGLDASYDIFDVPPESLREAFAMRRDEGFLGLNLTVPDKVPAVELMDHLDASAELFGAVNTVRFAEDGSMTGFNTDSEGFLQDLKAVFNLEPNGRVVQIVGCGGAGRAIAIGCAAAGAAKVVLANRTLTKAESLAEEIHAKLPKTEVSVTGIEACEEAEIIVQCTTCGLHPGDTPVLPKEAFHPGQALYDIVYTSAETPTMQTAHSAGAKACNGAGMLARQGAQSFKIWTGLDADVSAMLEVVKRAR